jgi:adenylate kinase family enzyme
MTSSRIWIGGGTGGGKSTSARALAVRHGLRRFAIDSFWYAYDARWAQPRKSPDGRSAVGRTRPWRRRRGCGEVVQMTIEEFDAASRVVADS